MRVYIGFMASTETPKDPPSLLTANEKTASSIRAIMAARSPKLTGKDLARALGISQQTASRWLNGQHDFKLTELEKIADWLKVPIKALILPDRTGG